MKSSKNYLSKWKAESINFTRHREILTLNSLEDDLGSLDELLEESKNLFSSAQQAVDNAAATFICLTPENLRTSAGYCSKAIIRSIRELKA